MKLFIQRHVSDKNDIGSLDIACTLFRKNKLEEDLLLTRKTPNYVRRLGSAVAQLYDNQVLPINSDNYSTTEIYDTKSNRLFATVYATYVQGIGVNCIVVISSMLNKVFSSIY